MRLSKTWLYPFLFVATLVVNGDAQDPPCPTESGGISTSQLFPTPCTSCAATLCQVGTTCCSDGCNTRCVPTSPGFDRRCPPPGSVGVCAQLCDPGSCGRGQICCSNGCGTSCIAIPDRRCPNTPIDRDIRCVTVDVCTVPCPLGQICCTSPCGRRCIDIRQDRRCPNTPIDRDIRCVTVDVCTVPCPRGQICCTSPCGRRCIDIPQDPRCPALRGSDLQTTGCPTCFRGNRCPRGQICCRAGCGSICLPIPTPTPDPVCPPVPTGIACVAPVSCPRRCPTGLVCCPHPCGTACIDIAQDPRCPAGFGGISTTSRPRLPCLTCASALCIAGNICCNSGCNPRCIPIPEPTPDPRCPLIRPGGPCPAQEQCPRTCPPRHICCPSFCGTSCIELPPDPTCPPRPTGPFCVAPVSCPPRCPRGLSCCPHPCGTSCIDTSQDSRCPASLGTTNLPSRGNCVTCRTARCRSGTICCNPGCAPQCIRIPRPPRICPRLPNGVRAQCSNGRRIGSVCRLSCTPPRQLAGGVNRVTCRSGGSWEENLDDTRCVRRYDDRCPTVQSTSAVRCHHQCGRCRPRFICCPNVCGSSCIPIPTVPPPISTCPPLVDLSNRPTFSYRCDRGRNVGSVCTIYCPPRQYLLGSVTTVRCLTNGNWNQDLGNSRCVPDFDRRCPIVPPGTIGICTVCSPSGCGRGRICCPTGCGSSCIDIPGRSCPRPYIPPGATYTLECRNGYGIGSTCQVQCRDGYRVRGNRRITCGNNYRWTPGLQNTRCVRAPSSGCPPGVRVHNCLTEPCRNPQATCSTYPTARCVNDYCGGCYFYFVLDNTKLTTKQCRETNLFNRFPSS